MSSDLSLETGESAVGSPGDRSGIEQDMGKATAFVCPSSLDKTPVCALLGPANVLSRSV